MVKKGWPSTALICVLCIWPLYSMFSAVYYHWWKDTLDRGELLRREYQEYLEDNIVMNNLPQGLEDFEISVHV